MFLTYILQYISSVKSTRTHVPLFSCSFSRLQFGTGQYKVKNMERPQQWRSVWRNVGKIHKTSATRDETRCCYNGHFEQPHSRAVSISSEYEEPSVQRKTTFRFLLLVTPQQTPGGAVAWQDRGQSMRGILPVDVQVLKGWCLFSCSRTISP